jgi:MipA family protein
MRALACLAALVCLTSPAVAGETFKDRWTITVGAAVDYEARYLGDDSMSFGFRPLFSVGRGESWKQFRTVKDGISIGVIDVGAWRLGPNAKLVFGQDAGDSADLTGLSPVKFTFELGGFAEVYPTEWLRLRAAVRHGLGGHKGLVAEAQADVIGRFGTDWTASLGPRLTYVSSKYADAYVGVSAAEVGPSGLPAYAPGSGFKSFGLGAQITRVFEPGWRVSLYGEYERLAGDFADAPLIVQRGSANQFEVGLAASYTFPIGR